MEDVATELKIECDIRPEDYGRACYAHLRRTRSARIVDISAGVVIAFGGVYLLTLGEWFGAVAILFGALVVAGSGWLAALRFRRDKLLATHVTAEFAETGVSLAAPDGNSQLSWSAFVNFAETDEYLLLYRSRLLYHFFPKRCIPLPDQEALRRVFLAHSISPRRPGSMAKVVIHWLVIATVLLAIIVIAVLSNLTR